MRNLTVLLTGCGSEGAYGVIKSLRANGERVLRLCGLDTDTQVANRYRLDQFYVPPRRGEPDYLPCVLELAQREQVEIIYPIPTAELEMFASSQSAFEQQGQRLIVCSEQALRMANNKGNLFLYLQDAGLPCVPQFRIVNTWDGLVDALTALGYPKGRVCFKPPTGTGSQGFRILDANVDRLSSLLKAMPNSTLTNLQDVSQILADAEPFPELVVMEYLPGPEYDVDVLAKEGEAICIIPRRNEKMWYGMSLVCVTEEHPEIIKQTQEIVASLKLSYVISLTFKCNASGEPKLLEINPRIPGSIINTLAAGVNMPYLAVKIAMDEPFDIPDIKWGIKMIRYWEELFVDGNDVLVPSISAS